MGFLGGGSKSTSTSSNQNNGLLTSNLGSVLKYAGQGANAISALLNGDTSGFDAYKKGAGFDFASKQGAQGIMGSAAARGLLRSGSSGKALMNFGNSMADQYANNYMQQQSGLAGLGINAGNVLASSGQTSSSTQKSKGGLGGFLGSAVGAIAASDRKVKENIKKLGEFPNGLGKYSYNYIWDKDVRHVGVMADEVEKLYPEALGPVVNGYQTVNYDKLKEIV